MFEGNIVYHIITRANHSYTTYYTKYNNNAITNFSFTKHNIAGTEKQKKSTAMKNNDRWKESICSSATFAETTFSIWH